MSETQPTTEGRNILYQFTSNDKGLLVQDVEFWASSLDAMLQFYKVTKSESVEDKALRSIACARLAGLAQAMVEHFSAGVDTCIDTTHDSADLAACEAASVRIYEMSEKHTQRLEMLARRMVN